MVTIAQARIAHASRGRMRVKVHAKRGDASYFDAAQRALLEHVGVEHVDVNPLTSSLVVWHAEGLDAVEIGDLARRRGLFDLDARVPGWTLVDALAQIYGEFDAGVARFTAGRVDFRSFLLLALILGALLQAMRGQILAPAATMVWYALDMLNRVLRENGGLQPTDSSARGLQQTRSVEPTQPPAASVGDQSNERGSQR